MHHWQNRALTYFAAGLYVLVAIILSAPVFRPAEIDPPRGHHAIASHEAQHALRPVKSFVLAFPSRQDDEWIAQDTLDHLPPDFSLGTPPTRQLVSSVDGTWRVLRRSDRPRVRDPPPIL